MLRNDIRNGIWTLLSIAVASVWTLENIAAAGVYFVFTSENRPDSETFLLRMQDGRETLRSNLGTVGEYGRTDRRLYVLTSQNNSWQIRSWDLRSGTELPPTDLAKLPVTPIVNFTGFNQGLFVDSQNSLILWMGLRDFEVERKPGRVAIKESRQRYLWGGADLESGDAFEVDSPAGVIPGSLPTPMGQGRLGSFVEGGQFLLFDPDKRRLDPDSHVGEMKIGRWYGDGVGIVSMDKEHHYLRYATTDFTALENTESLLGGKSILGQVRFRVDSQGRPLALVALGGREKQTTMLVVCDPLSGEETSRKELPARLYNFEASQDGNVCLFKNKPEKKAVLFNRNAGSIQQIDFSRYEKAELIVDLSSDQ